MASPPYLTSTGAYIMRLLDAVNFVEIRSTPISNLSASGFGSIVRLGPDMFAVLAFWSDFSTIPSHQVTSVVVFETNVAHPPDGGT